MVRRVLLFGMVSATLACVGVSIADDIGTVTRNDDDLLSQTPVLTQQETVVEGIANSVKAETQAIEEVPSTGILAETKPETMWPRTIGGGIHAYFSGDYVNSFQCLSAVIDQGSEDPRVYFFRGLALEKLGRPEQAKEDYMKGAEMESGDSNRINNVSSSLMRVQGDLRRMIEHYRIEGRVAAKEKEEARLKARYEQRRADEANILHDRLDAAPEAGIQDMQIDDDPFAGDDGGLSTDDVILPGGGGEQPPAPAPVDDPFAPGAGGGDDPFAPAAGGGDDPFAPGAPVEPAPVEPAAGGGDDPFAPAAGGGDDPFAPGAPVEPAPVEPAAGGGDDPFAAPAPVEPAAGGGDDPFAAPAPVEPAAGGGDDPFAAPAPVEPAAPAAGGEEFDPFAAPAAPVEPEPAAPAAGGDGPFAAPVAPEPVAPAPAAPAAGGEEFDPFAAPAAPAPAAPAPAAPAGDDDFDPFATPAPAAPAEPAPAAPAGGDVFDPFS